MLVRREVVNGCTLHSQRPNADSLALNKVLGRLSQRLVDAEIMGPNKEKKVERGP